ncbi:SURF1 family cytochrome oxidase biogenesis protein [Erythrobacter sp. Alg231-14]|uniref:SURF1 family cytochrome oxidase biogenesis protein n=1 Tax=Erythrobacter sp. Alg231-14 TaxID=1922225 RepID=UPI000D561A2C
MMKRLPIIPTILVLAAAGVMVWLGFWQLGRADEKAALIAEYEHQAEVQETIDITIGSDEVVYRPVNLTCDEPSDWKAVAGRNARGQAGFAHRYLCHIVPGSDFTDNAPPESHTYADVGWSSSPTNPNFAGGVVKGVPVRMGDHFKIIASESLAGLEPLAKPDPNDLPNNHLAYAGQWFFFALTALIIYWLAVRSRLAKRD